jgi:hypothetical protein
MINSYKFGCITIHQKSYINDVIVFQDHVQSDWWRKEGHLLQLEDIQSVLNKNKPTDLVVGTGKFGIMKISKDVKQYLDLHAIRLYAEKTDKAVKTYNRMILTGERIMGAFHLTC